MGKKLVIKGADFTEVAVGKHKVTKTCSELLTEKGTYCFPVNTQNLQFNSNNSWRSAILPIKERMYVENASALCNTSLNVGNYNTPAIIFLSSDDISGYIQNSEVYPEHREGAAQYWGTFSGYLNPPANATHVIINTGIDYSIGGDLNAEISWIEDDE